MGVGMNGLGVVGVSLMLILRGSSSYQLFHVLMNREIINTHLPFVAEGGYYREEAIMLLRRFYMSENQNGKLKIPCYVL